MSPRVPFTAAAAAVLVALVSFVPMLGATTAKAGPNAHGALIVHWNQQLVYTAGALDYCGQAARFRRARME